MSEKNTGNMEEYVREPFDPAHAGDPFVDFDPLYDRNKWLDELFTTFIYDAKEGYSPQKAIEKITKERMEILAERPLSHADISKYIDLIYLIVGLFRFGHEFLRDSNFPVDGTLLELFEEKYMISTAKRAAERLNLSDWEPLMDRNKRNQEQETAIIQIHAQDMMDRISAYFESSYYSSFMIIRDEFVRLVPEERERVVNAPRSTYLRLESSVIGILNCYFYAFHPELNPIGKCSISEENRSELIEITRRLVSYTKAHGGNYAENVAPCFGFVQKAPELTRITSKDTFSLPLSKIWREQGLIAKEGAAGREVEVGKRTIQGKTVIKAAISDKDGNPLKVDELLLAVERAVANLIDEAGGKDALPIIVSPQRIYRAMTRGANETVTPQQAQEIERAMDVLMDSPARVDFTMQLKNHTRMKEQSDYDYSGDGAGRLSSHLIQASKLDWVEDRNGFRSVAYKIYDYPVLFFYSHIIGQIAQVPNVLLTGREKAPERDPKDTEPMRSARGIAIKQNVLSRVLRMSSDKKRKQPYAPVIKIDEVAADCGITLTDKTRRTMMNHVEKYLEELKAQRQIRGFSIEKSGRKHIGYRVQV